MTTSSMGRTAASPSIPREEAEALVAIRMAIAAARTWGDFKARIPPGAWDDLVELYEESDEELPEVDAPFDADDFLGYADGDYPAWPAQMALDWMPDSIINRLGRSRRAPSTACSLRSTLSERLNSCRPFSPSAHGSSGTTGSFTRRPGMSSTWVPFGHHQVVERR